MWSWLALMVWVLYEALFRLRLSDLEAWLFGIFLMRYSYACEVHGCMAARLYD